MSETILGQLSTFLGGIGLLYFLFEHFSKQIVQIREHLRETDIRFHVTEDKLGTLQDLEEEVRELKEAQSESTTSWEDDVVESGKYQAIVGKTTFEGMPVEIHIISERFHTFKENRYWLLDSKVNLQFIKMMSSMGFSKVVQAKDKIYVYNNIFIGLNELLKIQLGFPITADPFDYGQMTQNANRCIEAMCNHPKEADWKRALIPSETSSLQ